MGFKTPWFQLLFFCLFVSTVAYSKSLPVKLTSKDCAESCNTAKEGIVHKIEARDVREDQRPSEYQSASDINHEEQNIASLSDFDIEEVDDDVGGALDESANSGDGFIDIGGAHLDKTADDDDADDDADDWTTHLELPIKAINDSVDDTFWGNDVVDDELSKETYKDDEDDTSGADDDDTSGRDDDYAADKVDDDDYNFDVDTDADYKSNTEIAETLDTDDDDDTYDDDDTFDVDDDADDYESNAEETQDEKDGNTYDDVVNLDQVTNSPDDDDTYDDVVNLDHVTNSPDDDDTYDVVKLDHVTNSPDDDDSYDVVNLDHVINSPDDDDDTFRVDNVVDDSIKLPDQTTIDPTNVNGVEGPIQILEENHPIMHDPKPGHRSKVTQHHNPLNKHPDSKLGRLLTKHKDNGLTSSKPGKNNLHKDIYDDEDNYNDFESQTRKHKFQRRKGRRTLSVDENPDFEHVGNRDDVSGTEDQENPHFEHAGNRDDVSGTEDQENPHFEHAGNRDDVSGTEDQENPHFEHAGNRDDVSGTEDQENPHFEHAGNRDDVSGTEDQENLGNHVEGSVDNYDKAETIVDEKESPDLVQEDQIEGEEEEKQKTKATVDSSNDDEGIKAVFSTSENATDEIGQQYEEDKIEGEEEDEVKLDDENVLHSRREAAITEDLLIDTGDQDNMALGA